MSLDVIELEVVVLNQLGLHARPATLLAKKAMEFSCDLEAVKDGEVINLRSLMSILMMAAGKGSTLTLRASGEDAQTAISALEELFVSKFGED